VWREGVRRERRGGGGGGAVVWGSPSTSTDAAVQRLQERARRARSHEQRRLHVGLREESLRNSCCLHRSSRAHPDPQTQLVTLRVLGTAMSGSAGASAAACTHASALYVPSHVEPSLQQGA
jgi:hypothetical protein